MWHRHDCGNAAQANNRFGRDDGKARKTAWRAQLIWMGGNRRPEPVEGLELERGTDVDSLAVAPRIRSHGAKPVTIRCAELQARRDVDVARQRVRSAHPDRHAVVAGQRLWRVGRRAVTAHGNARGKILDTIADTEID